MNPHLLTFFGRDSPELSELQKSSAHGSYSGRSRCLYARSSILVLISRNQAKDNRVQGISYIIV
jgi:hypothetical protein